MKNSVFVIFVLLGLLNSCKQENSNAVETQKFREYVFGVQLVNDPAKIQEYLNYHKKIWPEVEAGFKKAGYTNIRLYHFGNYISMIINVPESADLDEMGKISEASHPRVKEWNKLMSGYQKGFPGTIEGTTWVPMDKIYEFKNKK